MTTTKDDQPLNRESRPKGATDARPRADTQASGTPAASQADGGPKAEPSDEFDPWKFGVHPVAADLRAEILAKGFPQSPGPGGFWEEVGKAKPSPPPKDAAEKSPPSPREADTLRLRPLPRVPVENTLRELAPWLVLAAIGTIVLLWLLMGHNQPKPPAPNPAADFVTTPKLPLATATEQRATTPALEPATTTPQPQPASATPSLSAVPNAEERVDRSPPKHGSRAPGTPKVVEPGPSPQAPPPSVTPAPSSNTRQFSIGPR